MNADDVLAIYENLADLTGQMTHAAKAGEWHEFAQLNMEARAQAAPAVAGMPALTGTKRLRKVDLLKHLMDNDRAIRDVTDPWDDQVDRALHAH